MKKIGIMTTGGDCSGLNTTIQRIVRGATQRNWQVWGILDGTDGLCVNPPAAIRLDELTIPIENARLAGSFLHNGHASAMNFETAAEMGQVDTFNQRLRDGLKQLNLDAICIPKTIDMDMPLTERTIGFDTAVQQLTSFCDQLMLTARSHHRWFVVQAMGRDCGQLALHAGVASGASAILIPEIKFDIDALVSHINSAQTDYGIIIVSEGISLRGHSGRPADMISRKLTASGITNRTAFPEHTQRAGDTTATDRILATRFADCALNAIANNETFVMTALECGDVHTVTLSDFIASGEIIRDPKIPDLMTSNAYVTPDNPLLAVAHDMGIYIGEQK